MTAGHAGDVNDALREQLAMPALTPGKLAIELARDAFEQRLEGRVPAVDRPGGERQSRRVAGRAGEAHVCVVEIGRATIHGGAVLADLPAKSRERCGGRRLFRAHRASVLR
jgi:hypothetical protein